MFAGCAGDQHSDFSPTRALPAVEAVRTRQGTLPLIQRLSGLVKARNQVEIYPEISAIITEVLVSNGDEVRRGQPLLRLRDTEFEQRLTQARANHRITEAQLRSARARLREAQAELERRRSLAEQGLASMSELEAAEAQAESAAAEVELAQARVEQAFANITEQKDNLSRTIIRSPIDGHVGNRNAETGMLAGAGTKLFTLGQLDSVRVEVVLTDRMLAYIEQGQRTEVTLDSTTQSAPLSRISPFLHPLTHSTEAEIDLANPGNILKPGMFVTVDIYYGESEEATLVPLSAIHENIATGLIGIFVAEESLDDQPIHEGGRSPSDFLTEPVRFTFVPIEMIAAGRMEAAVRPVNPGDWVVTVGQNLLGGASPTARVRPVDWNRVTRLQSLQREDLMREVIERKAGTGETD
jgi:HlyD family secretion protein